MENELRRVDVSARLMQMGQALMTEGTKDKSYAISQAGTVLIALSNVVLSDEDSFLFAQLAMMFTAKKILDANKGYSDTEIVKKMKELHLANAKAKKTRKPRTNQ